ncbi:MAG: DUF736 family protein [Spirochaetes bacterium]|nr:DUF736 family protein [Spirochaetota bacterium]
MKIGGAWTKVNNESGEEFISCSIHIPILDKRFDFLLFKNKEKKNEKSPDYNIVVRDKI